MDKIELVEVAMLAAIGIAFVSTVFTLGWLLIVLINIIQ